MGGLYATLGEHARASELLAAALAADRRALELVGGPDERAELLLSLAQTLATQGFSVGAEKIAATAYRTAASASMRKKIELWLSELDSAAPRSERMPSG